MALISIHHAYSLPRRHAARGYESYIEEEEEEEEERGLINDLKRIRG